jgi:hypothetical protein
MTKTKKFDLGKRIDGKLNRWELRSAKSLGIEDPEGPTDYMVPVITGVFKNRKEVFAK